ncbi:hypothetical protein HK407_10g15540 [Ordospora pajunii]|uniref:uncharacterized protein n=1 Tax=Ordospora pajunii TaxID=3039483 RepID=UPI00295276E7|nr:uncharacterized protein HK407_10g15540 [Ordospora pajunii]KAH9410788.1 hypothetical protein HK407_10g15540 [Ordospora pajunii]
MEVCDVVCKLLADGVVYGIHGCIVEAANELLRPMEYEVIEWPDRSCLLLKDHRTSCRHDGRLEEIKEVLRKVVYKEPANGEVLDMLILNGWVCEAEEGLEVTKRTLVQHSEFILSLDEVYKQCEICGFLSKSEMHEVCRDMVWNQGYCNNEV